MWGAIESEDLPLISHRAVEVPRNKAGPEEERKTRARGQTFS